MERPTDELKEPLVQLLLSVADDKFILGHRNADWTGLAPILEEDIAFSALAQDELAHALALYQMAAELRETNADKLAYGRPPEEYRCAQIVEPSDDFNWATALVRNFFCDHFDIIRLHRLAQSTYVPLAQLGARLAAEEQIHIEHTDAWMKRLGRDGLEAHDRMQAALDRLAEAAPMLLEPTVGLEKLEHHGLYPPTSPSMFERWSEGLCCVTLESGLQLTLKPRPADAIGGRRGRHSAAFRPLLDELTEVYRLEPDAPW
jgi:ring-1,2-phenylacetyl-CoA epoxidase subunit PaaC